MPNLKRQEVKPPVYLLNDALLRLIDSILRDVPVYFRQKDAETYFDNPFLLGGSIVGSFNRACQHFWFSPKYRVMCFDSRFLKPYTNEELINMFELPSDFLSESAKFYDSIDFSWERKPFPTPSKSIEELELEYIKAYSDYVKHKKT